VLAATEEQKLRLTYAADNCVDSLSWTVSATFGDCVSSGSATSTPYDFTTKCGGGSDSNTAFFGSTSAVWSVIPKCSNN